VVPDALPISFRYSSHTPHGLDDLVRPGKASIPLRRNAHSLGHGRALLLIHCIFNNRYDYFRDESDYLACAKHLAWGYVDSAAP